MAATPRLSSTMDRTGQWVFSQEVPTDVIIQVGGARFPLHKFMLVAKSGYIRRKILESDHSDLARIDLGGVPGGLEAFEKAVKFCYGVNFEVTVYNVAALRCAAEYLEMTERFCDGNLAGRTEEFLAQAALKTLWGAVIAARSCEALLPMAEEVGIVQRCVDVISLKACNEANFPTRSPPDWWLSELTTLPPSFLQKVLIAMKTRESSPKTLSTIITSYAEKSLPDLLLRPLFTSALPDPSSNTRTRQRSLLESIISLIESTAVDFSVSFLCCLLRAAVFLNSSAGCRRELERRISASLDQITVGNLLAVAMDYSGERVADMDSVRRIVVGFVERVMGGDGGLYGGGAVCCSAAVQKVARTVDAFVGEIATDEGLSVSKFAGIAAAIPKSARRFDDDLYRVVDMYLKAHPGLDEIEREKVCSVMDPLRLSYEARLHASQNKRLPLQVVLHALYYDQLKLRGGADDEPAPSPLGPAASARILAGADASLMKENETLRSELNRMKLYVSDLERNKKVGKKPTFLSTVSKKLGKLNPFRNGSKDTSNIDNGDGVVDLTKPRRRRFSIS